MRFLTSFNMRNHLYAGHTLTLILRAEYFSHEKTYLFYKIDFYI